MALTTDPLFAGLTRPSMKWGVTFEAFVINFAVCAVIVVQTHKPQWFGLCIPFHGICYLLCRDDPRAFENLRLWAMTKLLCGLRSFYKAASFSPLQLRKFKR